MKHAGVPVDTVVLDAGHALMSEQPDATLAALFGFAKKNSMNQA
jgi:pimeloyl-ACP methyl ester carboxylesterase